MIKPAMDGVLGKAPVKGANHQGQNRFGVGLGLPTQPGKHQDQGYCKTEALERVLAAEKPQEPRVIFCECLS